MNRKIVATYQYKDNDGKVVHETIRYLPKDFTQRRPDGKGEYIYNLQGIEPVLYNLPTLVKAIRANKKVFICEGEKDADNLTALHFCTTTCAMGAGKWRDSYTKVLYGADVVILPDKDDVGMRGAISIANELYTENIMVKIVRLPGVGKDVTDWIEVGGNREALIELVTVTPYYKMLPALNWFDDARKESTVNLLYWLDVIKENQFEGDFEALQAIHDELIRRSKFGKPYEYTEKCVNMALQERVPVVQLTATLLNCTDREAIAYLCKMYGINPQSMPKWKPVIKAVK